ncbi:MAG: ADP-ribosylglycohydrolase family protein, partial [Desulfovibrio sp.]|nr:ADP-ribosylglycohydrolase family protein [Desulfovibrio sp.]
MIGAIIGDMAGCRFERHAHQPGLDPLDFPLFSERTSFTDDTVLSFAVCEALMESSGDPERMQDACCRRFKEFARKYPR